MNQSEIAHTVQMEAAGSSRRSARGQRWTSFVADDPRDGWTTIAIDRATRRWAVAQHERQADAAREAVNRLRTDDR